MYDTNLNNRQKIGWIVSLRAFAAIAVVLLHVIGAWKVDNWIVLEGIIDSRTIFDEIVIQILVRWAVPCFLMISGFLLLAPPPPESKSDVLSLIKIRRYVLKMLFVLMTFGFMYCVIENIFNGLRGFELLRKSLLNLLEGNSWSHMWYVYMMIGIYLTLPLFMRFSNSATYAEYKLILLVLFAFTVFIPTVNKFWNTHFVTLLPIASCNLFYFLIGGYIRKYGVNAIRFQKSCFIIGILGFSVMLYYKIRGYNVSYDADNLFVCLYSIPIFVFACGSKGLNECSKFKVVARISELSFGIYVTHPIILNAFMKGLHIYPDVFPVILGELVFWGFAVVFGYLATLVLKRFCRICCF